MSSQKAFNSALLMGCVYEVVSLSTRRVPTITHLLRSAGKRHMLGRMLLWLWCGFISWHFLEPLPLETL